ncbi:hypothetical protein L226DRAFT_513548 [Lentinus tigrinus ALCF2SS1-7]|uniref:Uncharacterized protein n=1 Tax=Lentinus tigrinus ALCF2SS1-6 TaxID=1328759 RepID=A0A5C2S0J4_9APHY|nr:hypothetical protein L227DRAFT_552931 [Lentinus tigrinus ALCF2SS1-6]RPD71148.1 hypothetical protein L226DRAFT_513548 [Lentinus tigrinus ALCF2SS1-7]
MEDEFDPLASGTRRSRNAPADPEWYPWPDKQTCVLDILRHLPRSLFSDHQMQIILWAMDVLGVDQRPSLFVLKTLDDMLQTLCGIGSIRHKGPLGHVYYVNALESLLAQEMANPRIRPHLRFYPEDAGQKLKECWQASRWLHELSPDIATPMVRVGSQDYYVYEPAKLIDGQVIIPFRWYTRASASGSGVQVLFGEGWRTHAVTFHDGTRSYVVHEFEHVRFTTTSLSLSFPALLETHATDRSPDPRRILGRKLSIGDNGIHPWTYTNPACGNPWRARAMKNNRCHRVVAFPMWLYCDDTSGNMSKKWNKHNSWLFTAAGLPRELAQQEANVHFLSTSNTAPPLEMLHGIVGDLERGQNDGFWAWDVAEKEMVLVIPVVLAILGDNPMQSELACHIGLAGKFFCRNCMVYGHEAADNPTDTTGTTGLGKSEASASRAGSVASDNSADSQSSEKKKGKRKETMQELVDRARRFLGFNEPRTKDATLRTLQEIFQDASTVGGMTRSKKLKTNTGVKDTFQEFFSERLFAYGRTLKGSRSEKQSLLDMFVRTELPNNVISPVWRIKDLDPHQDTPVEILHVVLLGFLKYFWRDAVARLSDGQKKLLKTRLSSLDVSGLGFAPLSGETLVTYAGSLTGRDFRAISQVAPFVLYDLVPKVCYASWVALSALVPLIWQPEIDDLEAHLNRLQRAIDYFLDCTARWTPRWFNKPKFHILRHLVPHIRRFGPAVLFATEGFESFNAVVRGKSVHSNRQAPSRDIARAFARANRNRHLLSGGAFLDPELSRANSISATSNYDDNPEAWRTAGPLPLALALQPRFGTEDVIRSMLPDERCLQPNIPGTCKLTSNVLIKFGTTLTAAHTQGQSDSLCSEHHLVSKCASVVGREGEPLQPGNWVLVHSTQTAGRFGPLTIGHINEILQLDRSEAAQENRADIALLEQYRCVGFDDTYGLPRLQSAGWLTADPKTIICAVNVQHNCAAHMCTDNARNPRFSERERIASQPAMLHREPADRLLNTNQMRNARYVQQLRLEREPLDRENAILTGAQAEIDGQKAQDSQCKQSRSVRGSVHLDERLRGHRGQ